MSEGPARLKRLWVSVAGDSVVPHRPTLAASFIVALLAVAVVLGFVAVSDTHTSADGRLVPGLTTSAPAPSTTAPRTNVTLVPAPTTTVTTTATTAAGTVSTSPPASPGWCTPSDLRVSTSTNNANYPAGQAVEVDTDVIDVVACTFDAETAAGQSCPDSVTVEQSGNQVWPWPGQAEQCSPPAPTVLAPGDRESLAAAWNQQVLTTDGGPRQAPPGTYEAVGTWAWSAGAGRAPHQEQDSATFVVS